MKRTRALGPAMVAAAIALMAYGIACVWSAPAWSPDSKSIAFVTYTQEGKGDDKKVTSVLWAADVEAGRIEKLVEREGVLSGPAWSPDGKLLAAVLDAGDKKPKEIVTLDVGTRKLAVATTMDWRKYWPNEHDGDKDDGASITLLQRPFWTPDSKLIGYFTIDGVFLVVAGGGETLKVIDARTPVLSPDGKRIAATAVDAKVEPERKYIVVTGLYGKTRREFFKKGEERLADDFYYPSWTGDSKMLLVTLAKPDRPAGAWALDVSTGALRRVAPADRETANPVASPVGPEVAYLVVTRKKEGDREIKEKAVWLRTRDGKHKELVAPPGADVVLGGFSPDGKWLAYRVSAAGGDMQSFVHVVRIADGLDKTLEPK